MDDREILNRIKELVDQEHEVRVQAGDEGASRADERPGSTASSTRSTSAGGCSGRAGPAARSTGIPTGQARPESQVEGYRQ